MYRTLHRDACGCSIVCEAGATRDGALLILRCPMHEAAPYLLSSVDGWLRGDLDPARAAGVARMVMTWATDGPDGPAARG